jgi:hypothetical protein
MKKYEFEKDVQKYLPLNFNYFEKVEKVLKKKRGFVKINNSTNLITEEMHVYSFYKQISKIV